MEWWHTFDSTPFKLVEGTGYQIRLFNPIGLRYVQGERQITFLTEVVEDAERGPRFLFFRPVLREVYVPAVLAWDSGVPVIAVESDLILQRLRDCLDRIDKGRYRFVVGDAVYNQARSYANQAEQNSKS